MLLWFAGMAVVIVWNVFHDPAIDYRVLMLGAVLPDLLDAPTGGRSIAHTLLGSVLFLTAVMLATRGRRLLRRRLLFLPIGTFLHLVLDGMWTDRDVFWWPAFGTRLAGRIPSFDRVGLDVVLELIGAACLVWAWRRFRLGEPERRRRFLTTGRLSRDLAG